MAERGSKTLRVAARRAWRLIVIHSHRWIERTTNLLILSVLIVLPVVIGGVTLIANREAALPYLLFPPLASGGYSLFAEPGEWHHDVRRFVGGLTIGAASGWLALAVTTRFWYQVPPGKIHAGAVALGVFLTAAITLALDMQVPAAFSTALLVHVTGPGGVDPVGYVVSVMVGSLLVAGAYVAWRRGVYDRRAGLLYETIAADDQVFVPMYGETAEATATLGARLAADHDAGRVVLFGLVDGDEPSAHPVLTDDGSVEHEASTDDGSNEDEASTDDGSNEHEASNDDGSDEDSVAADDPVAEDDSVAPDDPVAAVAADLETTAERVADRVDVPCDVAVASGGPEAIFQSAHETDCDLVVAPAVYADDGLANFLQRLLSGDLDVLVHDSRAGRTDWNRVMVPVRRASDVAHSMIDFASRLAGDGVSVCRCVDSPGERPEAERALERLVSAFESAIETRVAVTDLDGFLDAYASQYDLVIVGASRDRSLPSRILSPPTYRRLQDIETDLAIVDRNYL